MSERRPPYHIAGGPGDTPDRILQQACDVVQQHWPAVEDDQVHGELAVPPRVDAAIFSWIRQANDAVLDSVHHRLGQLERAKQLAWQGFGEGFWVCERADAYDTPAGTVWVILFRSPHSGVSRPIVVSQDFDGVMVVSHASMSSM